MIESYFEFVQMAAPWVLRWLLPALVLVGTTSLFVRGLIGRRRVARFQCERCGQPFVCSATLEDSSREPHPSACSECGFVQPTPLAGSRRLWAKLVGGGIVSLTIAIYFLAQVRIDRDDLVRGAIAVACLASLWCACRVVFPLSGGVRPWSRASFLLAALLLAAPGALLVHRAFGRESLITQQRRAVASAVNTLALTPTPFRNGMSDRPHYLSELGSELLRHVYRPAWERRPEPGLLLQLHRWAQLSDIGLPLVTEFDNTFAGFPTPAEIRRCRHMTGLSALHFWSLNDDPETRAALLELSRTHVVTGIIRDAFGVKLERVRFEGGQRVFESPEVAPVSGPHNEDLLDKSPVDKAPADEAPTPHPLQAPPQPQTDSLADIR